MKKLLNVICAVALNAISRLAGAGLLGCLLAAGTAQAGALQTTQSIIANTSLWETAPTLCADASGPYVVYTQQPLIGTSFGPGDLVVQRLKNGATYGAPMVISGGTTDDQLNDCDGNYIVYTAFSSYGVGQVMLYDLSTGATTALSQVGPVREARINGTLVVWIEGTAGATSITMWDLMWTGTGILPCTIAGPSPPASNLAIGSRFVVWDERVGTDRQVMAYDRTTGKRVLVASDPALHERIPDTYGDWIVYESIIPTGVTYPPVSIFARNMATNEVRTITNDGFINMNPTIHGGYITYESNKDGDFDIYLYRISDGQTFQLNNDPGDQYLNNIHDDMVAHVDGQTGNADIGVVRFSFNAPIANAGADQTMHVGVPVTLSGNASYDPGGTTLTYAWLVTESPSGSVAVLATSNAVDTTFTPDLPGNYVFSLTVTNANGVASMPDTVVVSTTNTAPVADAGLDQPLIRIGTVVTLNGSGSYDVDGDPISYSWLLASKPGNSNATLQGAGTATPSFTADVQGTYVAQLVVSDAWSSSAADTVTVSFTNLPPVANAGANQTVPTGTTVTLNGSGSSDPNGDNLTYRWSLASTPVGSSASLANATTVTPSLPTDIAGAYVVSLVVNDGQVDSAPSNVTILATNSQTQAIQQATSIQSAINSLNLSVLKNANMRNALTNKIQAVQADIEAGRYADALSKLKNDILGKTDGCAKAGAPDANDWIMDCTSQGQVYPLIQNLIATLSKM